MQSRTFLVLGATGGTGRHFVTQALQDGHRVRVLVRSPDKLPPAQSLQMDVWKGSITEIDKIDMNKLTSGVDYIVSMLGDKETQAHTPINTNFVKALVPAMRQNGVKRFLYQAGGMSRPYQGSLSPVIWIMRNTLARFGGYEGQHRDNEAVIAYLSTEAMDIEWMVHRAGIWGDGPSKGVLERAGSNSSPGIAPFVDCARYSYHLVMDDTAVHTCDLSKYKT